MVVADKELFNKRAEFWISNMLEIKNPVLCIASETDWNYNVIWGFCTIEALLE